MSPPALTTKAVAIPVCPKCGTVNPPQRGVPMPKSVKRSCCVQGGAWFKNCGNPGEAKFDYTWYEGIQACKGKDISRHIHPISDRCTVCLSAIFDQFRIPTGTSASSITTKATVDAACPKCGTIPDSGKRSCCVPGGAWFGECGDAGNANAGHTWDEGLQACQGRLVQTNTAGCCSVV